MKKVLIFWLWFQWKKYINYFKSKWFNVFWVNNTWVSNNNFFWLDKLYLYSQIIVKNIDFYEQFDIIILAVKPYKNQQEILEFFIQHDLNNKIIVEKPVCYDLKIMKKLIYKENYFFFIDEIVLNKVYYKLFKNSQGLILKIYETDLFYAIHILEHIFWWFLLFDNFNELLLNIKIIFEKKLENENVFMYKIFSEKYNINCNNMNFYLNKKFLFTLVFEKSLESLFILNKEDNIMYKSNFYTLRKKLNEI